MTRLALALGCALAAMTVAADAHEEHNRIVIHRSAGADIDADRDGWVTRAEASAAAARMFGELDSDEDGRLDADDRQTMHFEMRVGGPVVEVQREGESRRVERIVIRRTDSEAAGRGHGHDEDETVHEVEVPPVPPVPPLPPGPPMFLMLFANNEEADANGDGALSREEFLAQHLRFFDASDANGDGRVRFRRPEPPEPPAAPEPPAPPRQR